MSGNSKTPTIIGIGEVVFDIMPDCRKIGGAPTDFLNYAVRHGAQGHLISAIGADDLGREVIADLLKYNIDPALAVTPYPTGRVLIVKNPNGEVNAHILENAAWDYIPFSDKAEECIKKADAVYFGTLAMRKPYSAATILDLIDTAPEGAYRFFDINLRQNYYNKETIRSLLKRADILKLNTEELKALKNLLNLRGGAENICQKLKEDYKLKYLILTEGAKESRIWGPEGVTNFKNSRVHQTFAGGAGNAFAGAFIASLLQGMSQKQAHETANKAAVEACRLAREQLNI